MYECVCMHECVYASVCVCACASDIVCVFYDILYDSYILQNLFSILHFCSSKKTLLDLLSK